MTAERAIQTRCPHCLGEQWVMTVKAFSDGEHGCTVCGNKTTPMTDQQWRDALHLARQLRDAVRHPERFRAGRAEEG